MLNELVELRSCSSSLFFEVLHFPSVAFVCDSVKQPSFTCLSCYTVNSQWYKDKLKLYIGSPFSFTLKACWAIQNQVSINRFYGWKAINCTFIFLELCILFTTKQFSCVLAKAGLAMYCLVTEFFVTYVFQCRKQKDLYLGWSSPHVDPPWNFWLILVCYETNNNSCPFCTTVKLSLTCNGYA
jgi:hypothetical protein